jgi:hypothetical protein
MIALERHRTILEFSLMPHVMHPDTQANFTRLASFIPVTARVGSRCGWRCMWMHVMSLEERAWEGRWHIFYKEIHGKKG